MKPIREEMECWMALATEMLKEFGAVQPVGIFITKDHRIGLVPLDAAPTKAIAQAALRRLITDHEPLRVLVITEAWFKAVNKEEFENYHQGSLETDPDRRETIIVFGWEMGFVSALYQPFTRDGEEFVFQPVEFSQECTSAFFPDPKEIPGSVVLQ